MIFYFTGTGNSLAVAEALRSQDEALINIADACKREEYIYKAAGERIGFILPTYFYTLGDIIVDFLQRFSAEDAGYVFAVITCGGGMGNAGGYLKKLLAEKGISLDYLSPIVMPDNAIFFLPMDDEEATKKQLEKADVRLEEIKKDISLEKKTKVKGTFLNAFCRAMYKRCTKTKGFWVEDTCVGCGKCAAACPSGAIEMQDGKPVWKKETCMKCAACINRCPMTAIQYGKGTKKKARYEHPILRAKKN